MGCRETAYSSVVSPGRCRGSLPGFLEHLLPPPALPLGLAELFLTLLPSPLAAGQHFALPYPDSPQAPPFRI